MDRGDWRSGALSAADARRRRRRTRALGVLLLTALGAAAVWGRCELAVQHAVESEQRAAGALLEALRGDGAAWAAAEDGWRDVARVDPFDGYGVFALELTDRLRRGDLTANQAAGGEVLAALAAVDLAGAEAAAGRVEAPGARRWLERLLAALRRAEGGG